LTESSKFPILIRGGSHADVRGTLRFCNDFDMSEVKRFYTISNSVAEPKRGWIMHKRETKWFFPIRGETRIEVECKSEGGRGADVFLLKSEDPHVLCVPPGYWFLIEQDGASVVLVFSNCHVGEFADDDFRRPLGNADI